MHAWGVIGAEFRPLNNPNVQLFSRFWTSGNEARAHGFSQDFRRNQASIGFIGRVGRANGTNASPNLSRDAAFWLVASLGDLEDSGA
jgi:hypothetical protein